MPKIKKGIKIIDVTKLNLQNNDDKHYKFIKQAVEEERVGCVLVEIDDFNNDQLICNVSDTKNRGHTELVEEMMPLLKQKGIKNLELWRYNFDIAYVKDKDRVIVSEKRRTDYDDIYAYCENKNIDLDNLFFTILSTEPIEKQ